MVAGGGGSGPGPGNGGGGGGGAGGFREFKSGGFLYSKSFRPTHAPNSFTVTAQGFPITVGGGNRLSWSIKTF